MRVVVVHKKSFNIMDFGGPNSGYGECTKIEWDSEHSKFVIYHTETSGGSASVVSTDASASDFMVQIIN